MRFRMVILVLLAMTTWSTSAAAFCGFYVAGGDAKLFNDATQVVLMRSGTTTVLSMQNSYSGPAENFAMVIPVPQVLQKENVKTLPKAIFDRVDQMSAPRLVEYWEKDPCFVEDRTQKSTVSRTISRDYVESRDGAVKIEAQFDVGEYEVVVLSATDSGGLEKWLNQNKYKIPAGADPYFRPYIERGQYFFVARVNLDKVKYEDGRAVLSPLRFQYTSDNFELPIRLGMINSSGKQDLLVYILAPGQRYDVANYPNATIPTNIEVRNEVRDSFPAFYQALFDATLEKTPKAVVTEYAWNAASCDPCPGPTLTEEDFATLGADVVTGTDAWSWTLTRLHARYSKAEIGEDLVFKKATGITGGREFRQSDGSLETGAAPSGTDNQFQGRYVIRHEWVGGAKCDNPVFGRWGGPNNRDQPSPPDAAPSANTLGMAPKAATPVSLASLIRHDIAEVGVKADTSKAAETGKLPDGNPPKQTPTSGCSTASSGTGGWMFAILLLLGFRRRA